MTDHARSVSSSRSGVGSRPYVRMGEPPALSLWRRLWCLLLSDGAERRREVVLGRDAGRTLLLHLSRSRRVLRAIARSERARASA